MVVALVLTAIASGAAAIFALSSYGLVVALVGASFVASFAVAIGATLLTRTRRKATGMSALKPNILDGGTP
ncbi:MAG TPA: hypothetical protein VIL09_07365 [Microvirga sp.]|jgi:hypothetical protein